MLAFAVSLVTKCTIVDFVLISFHLISCFVQIVVVRLVFWTIIVDIRQCGEKVTDIS